MAQKKSGGRVKHVPQRTCIGCRETAGKRGLIRIVRVAQGVEIDPTGKKAGRGAYIHPSRACWQAVLQSNRLGQALRVSLSVEDRQRLQQFLAELPEDEEFLENDQESVEEMVVAGAAAVATTALTVAERNQ
ncbi:MAG: YlxR family protein [Caldilineaceae bacterium]